MNKYQFEKPTITPHSLDQQLAALKELLEKRDADWAAQVKSLNAEPDHCTAFDDDALDEIAKTERKRT